MRRDWRSLSDTTLEEATAWRVRLADGDASEADYAAFGEWIAADAAHAAAYEAVELFDSRIDAAVASRPASPSALPPGPRRLLGGGAPRPAFMRYAALAASLAAIVAIGVVAGPRLFPPRDRVHQFASNAATETILLEDGTSVVLAPGASMSARIDGKSRRITDFRGVGFFDVAGDAARPFTIAFGDKSVTVVGTQFEVRAFPDRQSVSVLQGVVNVGAAAGGFAPVRLTAGKKAEMTSQRDGAPTVSGVSAGEIAPWRDGVLEFAGASLASVAQALNDIYGSATFLADDVGDDAATFSGVLQVSAPGVVARRLEELLPVTAENIEGRFYLRRAGGRAAGAEDED